MPSAILPQLTPTVKIPIIDISGYISGDQDSKDAVVEEVRDACENQGFLQVIGHCVPSDLQARFVDCLRQFFALPLSEKQKISQSNSKCHRGYERVGGQKLEELDADATPDQKVSALLDH